MFNLGKLLPPKKFKHITNVKIKWAIGRKNKTNLRRKCSVIAIPTTDFFFEKAKRETISVKLDAERGKKCQFFSFLEKKKNQINTQY